MLGVDVAHDAEAGTLALGQQQQIEIVKALWRGSSVLILDEPTSMLTPQGVAELAKVLARLKDHGLAVVFITHKLHEATSMGDRVTVRRQGRVVGSLAPDDLRAGTPAALQERIVKLMFGEDPEEVTRVDLPELQEELEVAHVARELPEQALLSLEAVSVDPKAGEIGVRDVSLAVRPGEIMGIAGVDGNGQRELAEAIAGQRPLASGDIRFGALSIGSLSVGQRQRLGLRYVTDDRLGEGTVARLGVGLNLVLKRIGQEPHWRKETADYLIRRYDIRTPSAEARVGTLSGGNVQKVVLARELSFGPKVVVYSKPTYGLDLKTTQAVRARIRERGEQGVSALVISTDLEELLDLCDRIAVLFQGRITGVVENGPGAEQRIGELMVGAGAA
jgi:simple sugar transport system ATP-binding protein